MPAMLALADSQERQPAAFTTELREDVVQDVHVVLLLCYACSQRPVRVVGLLSNQPTLPFGGALVSFQFDWLTTAFIAA